MRIRIAKFLGRVQRKLHPWAEVCERLCTGTDVTTSTQDVLSIAEKPLKAPADESTPSGRPKRKVRSTRILW